MSGEPPFRHAPPPLPGGNNPIAVAVAFMAAQDGGPERVLRAHVPNRRGGCRCCSVRLRPVRWPCAPAVIALTAQQNATRTRADHDLDDAPEGGHS
jgi:hypothetical protein